MKNIIILFSIIYLCCFNTKSSAQLNNLNNDSIKTKNRVDFLLLGNRSILNFIYNRKLANKKIVTYFINSGFGIVPGSHDQDTIPALLHLMIGVSSEFGTGLNKVIVGFNYSTIFKIGEDKINSEKKSGAKGIIGEIGYARYFPKSESVLKIMFTPILIGKEYRKFGNIPFGISYGLIF